MRAGIDQHAVGAVAGDQVSEGRDDEDGGDLPLVAGRVVDRAGGGIDVGGAADLVVMRQRGHPDSVAAIADGDRAGGIGANAVVDDAVVGRSVQADAVAGVAGDDVRDIAADGRGPVEGDRRIDPDEVVARGGRDPDPVAEVAERLPGDGQPDIVAVEGDRPGFQRHAVAAGASEREAEEAGSVGAGGEDEAGMAVAVEADHGRAVGGVGRRRGGVDRHGAGDGGKVARQRDGSGHVELDPCRRSGGIRVGGDEGCAQGALAGIVQSVDREYRHRFLPLQRLFRRYDREPRTAGSLAPASFGAITAERRGVRTPYRLSTDGTVRRRDLARPNGRRAPPGGRSGVRRSDAKKIPAPSSFFFPKFTVGLLHHRATRFA